MTKGGWVPGRGHEAAARRLSGLIALVVLTGGCASSSEPGEPPVDSPFDGTFDHDPGLHPRLNPLCDMVRARPIELDEMTDVVPTGREMLDVLEGSHRAQLHWDDPSDEPGGELSVAVETQGPPRFQDAMDQPLYHGATCSSWLEVDVEVTLRSEDGAVHERFEAVAIAVSPQIVHLTAIAPGEPVAGSLTEAASAHLGASAAPSGYQIDARFTKFGVSLNLTAAVPTGATDFHSPATEDLTVAHVGPILCEFREGAVALDRGEDMTGQDMLDRFDEAGTLQVAWADGSTADIDMTFTPAQNGACLQAAERDAVLAIFGELNLRSDEGRLDVTTAGSLTAYLSAPSATVHFSLEGELRSTDAADVGFPQIDSSLYGDLVTRLPLGIEADGTVVGSVRVEGEVDNDCTDEIAMDEHCFPTEYITLHEGTFSR